MSHAFYDEESDILWLKFRKTEDPTGERREWDVLTREHGSGLVTSTELWQASEYLPASLLEALPEPAEGDLARTDDLGYFDRQANVLWFRVGESRSVVN